MRVGIDLAIPIIDEFIADDSNDWAFGVEESDKSEMQKFKVGDVCIVKSGTRKRGWAEEMEELIFRPVTVLNIEKVVYGNRYRVKYSEEHDTSTDVLSESSMSHHESWWFYEEDLEPYETGVDGLKKKMILELVAKIDELENKTDETNEANEASKTE